MNLPFQIDLSGKVAVITGGAGVLCSAFAEALAQCGAKIAIIDRNAENGNAVADRITKAGGTIDALAGATITSRAITEGAASAISAVKSLG